MFSLTKSVTSMLVGIALEEGAIGSTDDKAVTYCPQLAGSAFDGPTVEDLLQMSSGAGGEEDYEDPDAPVNRLMRAVAGQGGTVLEAVRSVRPHSTPGTWFNYSTLDTQVLGWVLEAATGRTLAQYAAERLWGPVGAESDAYYALSRRAPRTAVGGGSFNATVRDMARLGLLMARGGRWGGEQIVPSGGSSAAAGRACRTWRAVRSVRGTRPITGTPTSGGPSAGRTVPSPASAYTGSISGSTRRPG
ncbi:serine hydrolase domain-containing protein [Streptomyces badius]